MSSDTTIVFSHDSVPFVTLILCGVNESEPLVEHGVRWLDNSRNSPQSHANKENDYDIIFKLAYALEASSPGRERISDTKIEREFQSLVQQRLPSGAWSDCLLIDGTPRPDPSVFATALPQTDSLEAEVIAADPTINPLLEVCVDTETLLFGEGNSQGCRQGTMSIDLETDPGVASGHEWGCDPNSICLATNDGCQTGFTGFTCWVRQVWPDSAECITCNIGGGCEVTSRCF